MDVDPSRGRAGAAGPLVAGRGRHPLLFVLGLGTIGIIPDRAALAAATVIALVELAAAGGYAAIRHGAGARGTVVSAIIALGLGLVVVLLKVLVH